MPRSILVVDANPGFGGMLCQALTAVGFECVHTATARDGAQYASTAAVDLAILDFHLRDMTPEDLVNVLRGLRPNILILGIPPDNNPQNPIIAKLGLQGSLTKPFYLPDLVPYVASLLGVEVEAPPEDYPEVAEENDAGRIKPPPPKKSTRHIAWLDDSVRAAAWLEQTAAAFPVLACMITSGADLYASAGNLSRDKLGLLARRVADLWAGTPGGSIVQFIKIPPDDEECLLYSMSIALNLDLTLLLERKTSLTTARRRAQEFQRALGKPPGTGTLKRATGDLARKPGGKTPTGGLNPHGA